MIRNMKKLIILMVGILVYSCSNNIEDLNQNVKDPASVSGESLFTSAEKSLVDQMVDLNVNNNNTKLWAQYLQETTYTDESNYDQVTRTIPAQHWSVMYKDVLKDLDQATKTINNTTYLPAEETLKPNKLAIIEILKIYTYANLVETFGNVPYTEALDINNLLPKYDDGLTIYKDLISRLTDVVNSLDTSLGSFGSSDRIYEGNTAQWVKFGNSLKLRMGILLSDVDPAFAESTVTSAISGGVIMSRSDNAEFQYLGSAPNTNPIYANLVLSGRHDFVAAKTIVDMLTNLNDPRLSLYFEPVDGGGYAGGVIGDGATYSSYSHVTQKLREPTLPGDIFDYAEVEFLMAEAAARGFAVPGTAKEHYDAGITESIEYWGGSSADAATYLAQPSVDYTTALANSSATTPWKEVIGNQKWLALFNRGMEAWTSIRLLDYPTMTPPIEAVSGYPNRYTYPIIEQTLNGDNYQEASSAIGGDAAETKLFWDLN